MTVLAYFPVAFATFIWDDEPYLLHNPLVISPHGLAAIWLSPRLSPQYYPVVFTSFWLEHRLWGLDLLGYHAVNVVLHGLNALLLWRVLRQFAVRGAWLAAAIFAVHPVHVESVAWITERKNVLSGFFYLLAFLAYWRFASPADAATGIPRSTETNEARARSVRRWAWYLLAFVLFLAALGSKTVTCSLPAAILLVLWWKRGTIVWRDVATLVPFFAAGLLASSVTAWLEANQVGAQGRDWSFSPLQRGLIAGRALWFYAGKLAWPVNLTFIYPRWTIDPSVWWQYSYPLAVLVVVGVLWRARRSIGRGPLTGVFFFAGTLVPALGFFNVYPMRYSFVADHFQYLASIGLIAVAATVAESMLSKIGTPWVKPTIEGCLLFVLALMTLVRSTTFQSRELIWTDTLTKNPACWMAHNNLGLLHMERREFDEAMRHYKAALRISADRPEPHYNIGVIFERQNNLAAAEEELGLALTFEPRYWRAHFVMGLVREKQGRPIEAAEHFRATLKLNPLFRDAETHLERVEPKVTEVGKAPPHDAQTAPTR